VKLGSTFVYVVVPVCVAGCGVSRSGSVPHGYPSTVSISDFK
jgi:hypothetical protein